MPKRCFGTVEEFKEAIPEEEDLLFDGTENLEQRPKNYNNQKDMYSGKKHTHTSVAMILSNPQKWIYYVSFLYVGSQVDFGIFKEEFDPNLDWFSQYKIWVDLGFVGFDKYYNTKELNIGKKKPRKSTNNPNPTLTDEEKQENKRVSKTRIYVEHAIGGMKRFRIITDRARGKCAKLKNDIIGICAGLHNYKLSLKT